MECGGGISLRNVEAENQGSIFIHSTSGQKVNNLRQCEGTQSLIAWIILSIRETWLSLAEMSPQIIGTGRQ